MFQNLQLPAAQEVCDSSSGVTPCIVMKNDGILYHEVLSFSPERWTKVALQELALVGSVYRLLWRYNVVQYYPISVIRHNEHHLHSKLCRARFLWTRVTGMLPFIWLAFQVWCVWTSPGFAIATICPKMSSPSFLYQSNKACRLHSGTIVALGNFMGYPKCWKRFRNPECRAECGAQFCDTLRLPLFTRAHSISDHHPTGKQELDLCCSPRGIVLYGGCLGRHPCHLGTL